MPAKKRSKEYAKMNHDYSHCSDYKHGVCPLECFRGMLVRDLDSRTYVSWISFKGTDECLLTSKNGCEEQE